MSTIKQDREALGENRGPTRSRPWSSAPWELRNLSPRFRRQSHYRGRRVAGHSQEDTPRSSLDSDRSKDFWEDSDDGQEEGAQSPKKGLIALPDGNLNGDSWVNIESTEDKSPGIKRKPVGSGLSPAPSNT